MKRPATIALRSTSVFFVFVVLLFVSAGTPDVRAQSEGGGNEAYDPALFSGMDYRMIGPSRGGRVTTVAGHRAHPGTFYMGSTGGGVWRTSDYGLSWQNISDGHIRTTASMGAIQVADSDPDVLYVGTGSDGLRSNVITGRGIYKSTDAGKSWTFLGLRDTGQIGAVEVHPTDADLVYVAALGHPFGPNKERGVYRSEDGGETWTNVLFVSDSTGAIDLEMSPDNPSEIYAAMWRGERKPWTIISGAASEDGIYKSTDGGDTWTKLENGLPQGLIGKIDLSISPADPDRVYALVEAPEPKEGLYRSDDRGRTFRQVSDTTGLMNRPFYYTNVHADPTDADVVYVSNESFFKSTDGGETFEVIPTPHGDNHDLWINPDNPELMVQSNDGGANVTLDGGKTWSTQLNQPTAELYQVHVDSQFPYWVYAGQQDNTTIMVPSLPPAGGSVFGPEGDWKAVGGCETGPAVPKPGDPTIVYSNCKGRFGRYSHATGQEKQYYVGAQNLYGRNPADLVYRFQRVVPIEVSPHNPDVLYHASQYVHRTRDEGVTWERISPDLTANRPERQMASGGPITRDITGEEHYSALYVVEESPLEQGVIWVGSNDGPVHVTRDSGATWTDVTPPDMPPEGRIQTIEPSPHQPGKAYVAGYRYLLDDWAPYLYRTTDYGRTWTRIADGTNGIPDDFPTRVVREDPEKEGLLYAGTEFGLFISFDDGRRWQPLQLDLPVTSVTDFKVHEGDLVVGTKGRSFWILDNLTPLHQLTDSVARADVHLFQPRDAYRMRYETGSDDPTDPEYPPPGATIDYYLAQEPAGAVTLEVLDSQGDVVQRFSSEEGGRTSEPTQAMRAPTTATTGTPRLSKEAGMHRFRWDLAYPGPLMPDGDRDDNGPLAVPGTYRVRLTVGDSSQTRPLRLRIDPRVAKDGVTVADLKKQLRLNLQIRDAISEAAQAAQAMEKMKADLERALETGAMTDADVQAVRSALGELEAALVTSEEGSYPQPMLFDQLRYLYGMTTQADQRLGQDAFERFEALRGQLDRFLRKLEEARQDTLALGDVRG